MHDLKSCRFILSFYLFFCVGRGRISLQSICLYTICNYIYGYPGLRIKYVFLLKLKVD